MPGGRTCRHLVDLHRVSCCLHLFGLWSSPLTLILKMCDKLVRTSMDTDHVMAGRVGHSRSGCSPMFGYLWYSSMISINVADFVFEQMFMLADTARKGCVYLDVLPENGTGFAWYVCVCGSLSTDAFSQ